MFTLRNKSTVSAMFFLLAFIFTLTANVIFDPATAMAGDVSQRDTASETAEESQEAKDKLSGAASGVGGFFSGIMGWITGVTDAVNKMWGMENGSGVAMVVNGIFYLLLVVGLLFALKMVFNIFTDAVKGENSVDDRYKKPSFRKK